MNGLQDKIRQRRKQASLQLTTNCIVNPVLLHRHERNLRWCISSKQILHENLHPLHYTLHLLDSLNKIATEFVID